MAARLARWGARLWPRRRSLRAVAVALAVAYLLLTASVAREELNQRTVATQIEAAGEVLATSGEVRGGLETLPAQIEAARAELARAREAFPAAVDGNDLLARVLELARRSGSRLVGATVLEPDGQGLEPRAGALLRLELELEGTTGSLLTLLAALEADEASASTRTQSFALRTREGRTTLTLELAAFGRAAVDDPAVAAATGSAAAAGVAEGEVAR